MIMNSGPDGGECLSAASCRGFNGTCALIADQFKDVAVLPYFPNGLSEYTCTAFPDDERPVDSFIVRAARKQMLCPRS